MHFDIVTIFPKIFTSYLEETIIARAIRKKFISLNIVDLRKFAKKGDAHKSVDGRPYGGGPGMILLIEPIFKAIQSLKKNKKKQRIIMLTPEGKKLTQKEAKRLARYDSLILLCGRYEGFDSRVEKLVDEKISIGGYVLAGGELPAMVVMEVVSRHIAGVVGHKDALAEETFSKGSDYIEYPQYTRPEIFYPAKTKKRNSKKVKERKGGLQRSGQSEVWRVPKVLLSGNHKKINEWRLKHQKKK